MYSIEQFKSITLPPQPKREVFYPATDHNTNHPNNIYHVTGYIARYFFNGELPDKGDRHNTARNLGLQAAICGIPYDVWLAHILVLVDSWFAASEKSDNDPDNTEQGALWAYDQIAEQGQTDSLTAMLSMGLTLENAVYACYIDAEKFERVESEDLEKTTEKIIPAEDTPVQPAPIQVDLKPRYTVDQIRQTIQNDLQNYVNGLLPDNTLDAGNSMLLLKAPPGAGKTHACINLLDKSDKPSAFLSLFKVDQTTGQEMFKHFGADTEKVIFIEARNPNEQSPGYCQFTRQAEKLGNKGENIIKSLCYFCEYKNQCEASQYLAQFPKIVNYKTLVARHNHGRIKSVMVGREIVVFDENPLDVVSEPVKVKLSDIRLPKLNQLTRLEYATELAIVERFLAALQAVIQANFPIEATIYPTEQNVKLGGRWLIENLVARTGLSTIENFISYDVIPRKAMNTITSGYRLDNSLEAIDNDPPNFIKRVRDILQYEYHTYFMKNCERWNSRLIPYGQELYVYEMLPFRLDKNVKVIVTDATGLPEYYPLAFTDHNKHARTVHIQAPELYPNATIIQFTGGDNTKNQSVRAVRRSKDKIGADIPAIEISPILDAYNAVVEVPTQVIETDSALHEMVSNQDNIELLKKDPALNRCQDMIRTLAKKHNGSLLVVTYKEFAVYLKLWAKEHNLLNPDYIQWFGNLKGKNDYEMLESCLIFGTPRIPVLDLLIVAQVWNWQNPEPINSAMELKQLPFKNYIAPDGKTRARQYNGYTDPRVDRLYTHLIQSEMRQCFERIRPDSSTEHKFVYIDSAFPCTDYVTELVDRKLQTVHNLAIRIFDNMLDTTGKVFRETFFKELQRESGCSEQTANILYDKIVKSRLDIDIEIGMVQLKNTSKYPPN